MNLFSLFFFVASLIVLFFILKERLRNGNALSRVFYIFSVLAFITASVRTNYIYGMSEFEFALAGILNGAFAWLFWYVLALIVDYFRNKKSTFEYEIIVRKKEKDDVKS